MRARPLPLAVLASGLLAALALAPASVAARASADEQALARDNSAFAVALYRQLAGKPGNLFLSPYSISTALTMTTAGARGRTEQQMARTLSLSVPRERLHQAFGRLERRVGRAQKPGQVELSIANSIWPQKKYPFLKPYLRLLKMHYGVSVTPLDFGRASELARKRINAWVEGRTRHKIRDLIKPGILDRLTRLVLVNAIYFKGNWARQFNKRQTRDAPFHVSPTKTVRAPLMTQTLKAGYARRPGLQVLELPYKGKQLSMVVLLPDRVDGLRALERSLTPQALAGHLSALAPLKVQVYLPKFKTTSMFSLNKALIAMGMKDAFDPNRADFSGMDGRPRWLYIAAVIHKAFVDVNEEGTEAAAATAVVIKARGRPAMPPTFRADHPFLFLIRHNPTGSILFIGRLMDPTI